MTPASHSRRAGFVFRTGRLAILVMPLALIVPLAIRLMADGSHDWKKIIIDLESDAELLLNTAQGRAGWTIRRVVVEGVHETPAEQLAAVIDPLIGHAALAVDLDELRRRLERIAWVRSAEVTRHLPDRLLVRISERRPAARWQHDGRFYLIAADGRKLAPLASPNERAKDLPLIVGRGADAAIGELLELARLHRDLFTRLRAAVHVGGRRWDLWLVDGPRILLPDGHGDAGWDAARALDRLADLERRHLLLERDLVAIDLRIADRVTLTRPPGHRQLLAEPEGKA